MKLNKIAAALIIASTAAMPAFADDQNNEGAVLPSEAQVREGARQMKQTGKERGAQARQAGEDKGAAAKQAGEQKRAQAQEKAQDMKQQGQQRAEEAREAAEEAGEAANEAAEEARQEADKIPPGMAKREEHPSSGKGSEQGQQSRAAEEKSWWRFWN